MGEYARANNQIRMENEQISKLKGSLEQTTDLEEREFLLEMIWEREIAIGEIKGALLEMATVDGLDDPYMAFDY